MDNLNRKGSGLNTLEIVIVVELAICILEGVIFLLLMHHR